LLKHFVRNTQILKSFNTSSEDITGIRKRKGPCEKSFLGARINYATDPIWRNIFNNISTSSNSNHIHATENDFPNASRNNNNNNGPKVPTRPSHKYQPQRNVRAHEVCVDEIPESEEETWVGNVYCTAEDLLIEEDAEVRKRLDKSPYVHITIGRISVMALLDTGSEVSCISARLFGQIRGANGQIDEFPVTNTVLRGAFGNKSQKISSQVFWPINLESVEVELTFIVVQGLVNDTILGMDTSQALQADILLSAKKLCFCVNEKASLIDIQAHKII
jgi:Retroviral aspartyl protease